MAKQTAAPKTRKDQQLERPGIRKQKSSDRTRKILSLGMPLGRENYIYLAIGVGGILLSYVLMVLDNQVDGFVSITLCPILLLVSYAEIIFAILYKKTDTASASATSAAAPTPSKAS